MVRVIKIQKGFIVSSISIIKYIISDIIITRDHCIFFELFFSRYQKRCDELEVTNGQFREKYSQMGDDKKEIVGFLKKSLEQRGMLYVDLNIFYFRIAQKWDWTSSNAMNVLSLRCLRGTSFLWLY